MTLVEVSLKSTSYPVAKVATPGVVLLKIKYVYDTSAIVNYLKVPVYPISKYTL